MSMRGRAIACLLALGLTATALVAGPAAVSPADAATVPGQPGTPQAGDVVFTEDFGNGTATNPISILNYAGTASAQNVSYTADPYWTAAPGCNGFVVMYTTVNNTSCPNASGYPLLRSMALALGQFNGLTATAAQSQRILSEATDGTYQVPPVGQTVMLKTVDNRIPMTQGHFYVVSAQFAAIAFRTLGPFCDTLPGQTVSADPSLTFSLLNGTTKIPLSTGLNPCTAPGAQIISGGSNNVAVANVISAALKWNGASTAGLVLENLSRGWNQGNDAAFTNPTVIDATPQLDKSFSPSTIAAGGVTTLTFTITNTLELAAKNGWAFHDVLPSGLVPTGVNSTTCPSGVVTAPAGATQVAVTGNLTQGETSCSVTVQVRAASPGTYVNGAANFPPGTDGLLGLNPPNDATLTVQPPASLVITKSSSTSAITTVGQVVTYKFLVENRGATTLTGLTVTDTQVPPASQGNLSAISCPVTSLTSGSSTTCTATYRVTQADLDHGSLSDSATATATGPAGAVAAPPSLLTIGPPAPAIAVVKATTTTLVSSVGQQVPYTFTVTNTGNVSLSGVSVTDTQTAPASAANMSGVSCPATTLAPGASTVCTGTYTATQADLANGSIADSAVASATGPGNASVQSTPSTLSVPSTLPGSLTIVKASTVPVLTGVGQQVPYTFTVTNNSSVTINNLTVVDTQASPALPANMSAISCPLTTLTAGASTVCTGTYTLTRADFQFGQLTDSAVARGTDPLGAQVVSSPSTLTRTVAISTLSLVKASTTASVSAANQQIPYTFVVTNTGNQTITSISVTDTQTPPASQGNMGPITCPQTTLAPSASTTCTGTYTTTAADIANGSVNDSALATGSDPLNAPVDSPQSSASVPVVRAPLTIVKSSSTDALTTAGQVLSYTFTVTNHSTATYTNLSIDDQVLAPASAANRGPITCPQTTLAPGQSVACTGTYTSTVADLVNGAVTDVATASATDPGNAVFTTGQSSVVVPLAPAPSVDLAKASTTSSVTHAGQVIPYTFTVTNTGNRTLTGVGITDAVAPPSTPGNLTPVVCAVTTLLPLGTTTCTAQYTVTQADMDGVGPVTDAAVARGLEPGGATISSPSRVLPIPVVATPSISVVKDTTTTSITRAGQVVPYTFTVTNTGNQTLHGIVVNDALPDTTVTCPQTSLAPQETVSCAASYVVTQADVDGGSLVNTATASATTPANGTVSATSSRTVPVAQSPSLTVTKSVSPLDAADFKVGEVVTYTYVVTNTGNVTMKTIAIDETAFSGTGTAPVPVCPSGDLAPGAQVQCTATYTVTQPDVDSGKVTNTASATGTPPIGAAIASPPSSATFPLPAAPAMTIVKSASPSTVAAAGAQVTYSYLLTNTGNVTLTSVGAVEDPAHFTGTGTLPVASCPEPQLAPGQFETCTAEYTVTQHDADAGVVSNTAAAVGTAPGQATPTVFGSSTAVFSVTALPALTVEKASTTTAITKLGQVVPYTFTVTNSGNVTLTSVTVTDTVTPPATAANLSPVACPQTELAPSESTICTASYTVTQADLDAGKVGDSAVASGRAPRAETPTESVAAPLSIDVTDQTASLTETKSADATTLAAVGQVVHYSFVVVNTGTLTLEELAIVDAQAYPEDVLEAPPACPTTILAPGESVTCTASLIVTAAAFARGHIADTAVAQAMTRTDQPIKSNPSTVELEAPASAIPPAGGLPATGGGGPLWIPPAVLLGVGAALLVVAGWRRRKA